MIKIGPNLQKYLEIPHIFQFTRIASSTVIRKYGVVQWGIMVHQIWPGARHSSNLIRPPETIVDLEGRAEG